MPSNLYVVLINKHKYIPDPDFGFANKLLFIHLIPEGVTCNYVGLSYLAAVHNCKLVIKGEE